MKKYISVLLWFGVATALSWLISRQMIHYFLYQKNTISTHQKSHQVFNAWQILAKYTPHQLKIIDKPYVSDKPQLFNQEMLLQTDVQKPWLIVNFWGTWCPPCVRELPLLNQFYNDHQNYKKDHFKINQENQSNQINASPTRLIMLGIAFEDEAKIKNFLVEQKNTQQLQIDFPLFKATSTTILEDFQAQSFFPLTFLIDPKGNIIEKHIGELNRDILNRWQAKIDSKR
jgi:thiol-disulfide isomerase/thioredoxin